MKSLDYINKKIIIFQKLENIKLNRLSKIVFFKNVPLHLHNLIKLAVKCFQNFGSIGVTLFHKL